MGFIGKHKVSNLGKNFKYRKPNKSTFCAKSIWISSTANAGLPHFLAGSDSGVVDKHVWLLWAGIVLFWASGKRVLYSYVGWRLTLANSRAEFHINHKVILMNLCSTMTQRMLLCNSIVLALDWCDRRPSSGEWGRTGA